MSFEPSENKLASEIFIDLQPSPLSWCAFDPTSQILDVYIPARTNNLPRVNASSSPTPPLRPSQKLTTPFSSPLSPTPDHRRQPIPINPLRLHRHHNRVLPLLHKQSPLPTRDIPPRVLPSLVEVRFDSSYERR